ncbi:MAG TPA: hypothetical protein VE616_10755 [Candidatus Udaeobacter sp.]|jgi:hypothetical protein|nr:hypothetical protein [Candidatus Udaeobacter sp.]
MTCKEFLTSPVDRTTILALSGVIAAGERKETEKLPDENFCVRLAALGGWLVLLLISYLPHSIPASAT